MISKQHQGHLQAQIGKSFLFFTSIALSNSVSSGPSSPREEGRSHLIPRENNKNTQFLFPDCNHVSLQEKYPVSL